MDSATALASALDARPFDHLGLQPDPEGKGLRLRAWLPDASSVEVTDLKTGRYLGAMTRIDARGLFQLRLPRRTRLFDYRLRVDWSGHSLDLRDPYQFTERAQTDLAADPDQSYRNLGAQLCTAKGPSGKRVSGVRFAVYAPNARAVSVIGSFNHWDMRRHPMMSHDDGIWRLFVPELDAGTPYKFALKNQQGDTLPHKQDPYGSWHAPYPDFHSVVWDHEAYAWQDDAWQSRTDVDHRHAPMAIYELQVGSWRHRNSGEPLTYRQLARALIPYIRTMGYTHVELLPISEYPFDGSWGYQPVGLFAPSSRFGTPDDFKYLVDQCHQAGIGVIVDWVPAHFPADTHGLANFDGTPLYEYADPRKGWHPDWHSHIYDYGRQSVCDFLTASALVWLQRFHVDGLRVDAVASMLYLDYSRNDGEWLPNQDGGNLNYEAIALLKRVNESVYRQCPNSFTVAEESTAFPGVSRPIHEGGLGFGFKWNMGWMHDTLTYMQKDPIHRRYHHNDLTFSLVYAFDEHFVLPLSHDEVVHGKGTLLDRMPGDDWQKHANLRAYYAYMYTHPGKKLSFMGNEFASTREWDHQRELDWWLLDDERHAGCQRLVRDLNHLYRKEPALHELEHDPRGFRWINHDDSAASVISFCRCSDQQDELVVVVCNFTPMPHPHYRIGVPQDGEYRIVLNSDSAYYGGSNYDAGTRHLSRPEGHNGLAHALDLSLPPLSTLVLKRR